MQSLPNNKDQLIYAAKEKPEMKSEVLLIIYNTVNQCGSTSPSANFITIP